MALLSPEDAKAVAAQFEENLQRPVKLVVATSQLNCMYCDEVKALSEELAELSPNLTVESYDLDVDVTDLAIYNLDKTPAIAIVADGGDEPDTDYGIRFYGIPSGYEFMSLLDAINTVGSDHVHLRQDTLDFLNDLDQDLHIQVRAGRFQPTLQSGVYFLSVGTVGFVDNTQAVHIAGSLKCSVAHGRIRARPDILRQHPQNQQ